MKRKIVVEIKCGEALCLYCPFQPDLPPHKCLAFSGDREIDENTETFQRLPACLEAEREATDAKLGGKDAKP